MRPAVAAAVAAVVPRRPSRLYLRRLEVWQWRRWLDLEVATCAVQYASAATGRRTQGTSFQSQWVQLITNCIAFESSDFYRVLVFTIEIHTEDLAVGHVSSILQT